MPDAMCADRHQRRSGELAQLLGIQSLRASKCANVNAVASDCSSHRPKRAPVRLNNGSHGVESLFLTRTICALKAQAKFRKFNFVANTNQLGESEPPSIDLA